MRLRIRHTTNGLAGVLLVIVLTGGLLAPVVHRAQHTLANSQPPAASEFSRDAFSPGFEPSTETGACSLCDVMLVFTPPSNAPLSPVDVVEITDEADEPVYHSAPAGPVTGRAPPAMI